MITKTNHPLIFLDLYFFTLFDYKHKANLKLPIA